MTSLPHRVIVAAMKHSAELASLRTLSALGLTPELYIPALLEALHGVIASLRNLFGWTDAQGRLVRYFFDGPIDHAVAAHYFAEFHNRREGEAMPTFHAALSGESAIRPAGELDNPRFFGSALYREIWRPQGLHTRIEAVVRGRRAQPLGSLVLYRGPGDRPFSRAEEQLFSQVAHYAARALEAPATGAPDRGWVARRDRRATLSLDRDGRLRHVSADALKLLLLSHGGITPDSASRAPRREDFATLSLLWQRQSAGAGKAALTVQNAWGRFGYESTLLAPLVAGETPVVQVDIVPYEPARLGLWRAIDSLPLAPAQREVCALLHAGRSTGEIARALAIAPSTVSDHAKKIYARLDVHSAHELSALVQQRLGTVLL